VRPEPTAPLAAAAARRHELTRSRAVQAIRELDRSTQPVTFASVAAAIPGRQRATDASLRSRLAAALERNRQLTEENGRLKRQLAHALGDQRSAPPRSDNNPTA
jgi:hypothetical protein